MIDYVVANDSDSSVKSFMAVSTSVLLDVVVGFRQCRSVMSFPIFTILRFQTSFCVGIICSFTTYGTSNCRCNSSIQIEVILVSTTTTQNVMIQYYTYGTYYRRRKTTMPDLQMCFFDE